MVGGTGPFGGANEAGEHNRVVRVRADAVVPCDGSTGILRPGVVEVSGDTVTHVGGVNSLGRGPGAGEVRVRGALLPVWSTSTVTCR